jgi:hypothetical protein
VWFSACAAAATLLSERIAPRNFVIAWRLARWVLAAPLLSLAAAALRSYVCRRPFAAFAVLLHGSALGLVLLGAGLSDAFGERSPSAAAGAFDWALLPASGLITLALLMLTATALTLATRLRPAPVVTVLCVLFALGLMADSLPDLLRARGTPLAWPGLLVPNLERFWHAAQPAGGAAGCLTLYALLYTAGALGLGVLALRSREV